MPIQAYEGFKRMTSMCKTFVPEAIWQNLEPIKEDESLVKAYGIKLCTEMCETLINNGVQYLHFYTLNLEKAVIDVIHNLKIERTQRKLPWRKPSFKS
jgi:methylenetetrahydrofolate reductase (NADPH)